MFSLKATKLIIVAALVMSLLAVLGVTLKTGRTASAKVLVGKLLRRHDRKKLKPDARELDLLRKNSTQQEHQERLVEDKIPKQVPIKVKLKAEREAKFKDLNNSNWIRDFELEVTNTSDKPIYFLELWVVLPGVISQNGMRVGIPLRYGRADFIQLDTLAIATDIPIKPGGIYTFTIPEKYQRGWQAHKGRENRPDPKQVQITFTQLSFGDGTGFNGTDGMPYPYKRDQSSNGPCREGPKRIADKTYERNARTHSLLTTPAAILPVSFLRVQTSYRQPEPPTIPDINCPGTDCIFARNNTYQCVCNSYARTFQIVGSSDPNGRCSRAEFIDTWCDDLEIGCPEYALGACASSSPTPTPTPSPEPICDPATKPNPSCHCESYGGTVTPHWLCLCLDGVAANYLSYSGGCDQSKTHNNGSDCCVCNVQTCPDGSAPDKYTCECPTPTPDGGSGGAPPDPNPQPLLDHRECVDYYWVHFTSYDGGQTWSYADNETYAGCFYED